MFFKNFYNKIHIFQNLFLKEKVFLSKRSYSSDGVDLIISKYFKSNFKGFFIDVGCFHPTRVNNTYLLYKKGWRGINIDISKFSIDLFNFWRKQDVNIHGAISNKNGFAKMYYQKEFSYLSTLNKKHAKISFQGRIKEKLIRCFTLTSLIKKNFKTKKIDFLNIDAEGNDFKILKSLDFKNYRPKLICIEDTDLYYNKIANIKKSKIYNFLIKLNYKYVRSGIFDHLYISN
jgi:FkbM family methyltransferase